MIRLEERVFDERRPLWKKVSDLVGWSFFIGIFVMGLTGVGKMFVVAWSVASNPAWSVPELWLWSLVIGIVTGGIWISLSLIWHFLPFEFVWSDSDE